MTHIGACGASLLSAQKFPSTTADLSFQERIENKAAGYEPYAEMSAYQMLKIQELNEYLADEIKQLETQHQIYCAGVGRTTKECQPVTEESLNEALQEQLQNQLPPVQPPAQNPQPPQRPPVVWPPVQNPQPPVQPPANTNTYCAARHPHIPSGQTVPIGVPISPNLAIYDMARDKGLVCSPFGGYRGKKKNGQAHYHQGVDLGCAMAGQPASAWFGSPVFTTARGVVKAVQPASECKASGNMIKIEHVGGFISYYMHLDKMFVRVGDTVEAGCQIGTMGHTGGSLVTKCPKMDIDMTHLHYELGNPNKPSGIKIGNKTIPLTYKGGTSFDPMPLMQTRTQ